MRADHATQQLAVAENRRPRHLMKYNPMLLLPLRSCYPGPQVSEMGRDEDLQAEQGEGRTGGSEDWSSGGGMHNASRRDR